MEEKEKLNTNNIEEKTDFGLQFLIFPNKTPSEIVTFLQDIRSKISENTQK